MSQRRVATAFFIALLTLPVAWSVYSFDVLDMDRAYTSSRQLGKFLDDRPLVVTWCFGYVCCRVLTLAMPRRWMRRRWWVVDALVFGGILIGHCLWPLQ